MSEIDDSDLMTSTQNRFGSLGRSENLLCHP